MHQPQAQMSPARDADASNFVDVGSPLRLIPYATAEKGQFRDHVRLLEEWDETDMRKRTPDQNVTALAHEAALFIATQDLMDEHGVTPHVKVIMPGLIHSDLTAMHVALNTDENCVAAASVRHYVDKEAVWEHCGMTYKNKVGKPSELIPRVVDYATKQLVTMLTNIDEDTIR